MSCMSEYCNDQHKEGDKLDTCNNLVLKCSEMEGDAQKACNDLEEQENEKKAVLACYDGEADPYKQYTCIVEACKDHKKDSDDEAKCFQWGADAAEVVPKEFAKAFKKTDLDERSHAIRDNVCAAFTAAESAAQKVACMNDLCKDSADFSALKKCSSEGGLAAGPFKTCWTTDADAHKKRRDSCVATECKKFTAYADQKKCQQAYCDAHYAEEADQDKKDRCMGYVAPA